MLCDTCLGIFEDTPLPCHNGTDFDLDDRYSKFYLLPHHLNFDSLQASAQIACTICCRLRDASNGVTHDSTQVIVKMPRDPRPGRYPCCLTFQYRTQAKDDPEASNISYSLEPYTGMSSWPPSFISSNTDKRLDIEDDTPSILFKASDLDHCPDDCSGSDRTLQLVKSWTENCANYHDRCFTSRFGWLPTRLLDIRQESLRLVMSENSSGRYTTLNHCWGEAQFTQLTKSNVDRLMQGFSLTSLPKTFRDAISVTRSLGIDFIWIDSLCIIQDSKSDWETESARMGQVYQYSYCNIAATGAHDSTEGLFFERNKGLLETFDIQVNWSIPKTQGRFVLCPIGLIRRGVRSPLYNRGWDLQEQLLAPRTVSFDRKQVVCFCREHEACEAFPKSVPVESWWQFVLPIW